MDLKNYLQSIIGNNIEEARKIRKNKGVTSSSEEAYAYIVGGLRILHKNISAETLENSITDEDHDQQIDAIVIEDKNVTIYDFKRSEGFGENEIRLFVQSVDKYIFNTDEEINKLPISLQNQITAAREAIDVQGFMVKLLVVRGGGNSEYDQGELALNEITYDSIVERKLVSLRDLINEELNLDSSPISYDWNITIKKNASGEKEFKIKTTEDSQTSSLICRISLQQLVKLYHDFQPKPEKIFEKNVRGLQNNKKIGNQILSSLSSRNKSRNFYKLHNGITIVSDKIIEKNTTGYIIKNPQIVNGCQTITTISEKFKNDLESKILVDGSIICKIFAAKNDEVENICLASNSQIAINAADLRTNDSIQIIIESYLRKNGIVYDRKSVKVSPKSSFTFKDLGQWCCACLLLKPAFAKKNKSQIFSSFAGGVYDKIFNDKTNLFEISKIVELALFIRQKIKQLKKKDITYQVAADLHFLAALFMLKDNGWKNEYAFTRVNAIIKKVSEAQLKANPNTTNPIIFTKNDDAWQKIEKEISSLTKIKKGK